MIDLPGDTAIGIHAPIGAFSTVVLPMLLLAGLWIGATVHDHRTLKRSIALTGIVSVLWGLMVAVGGGVSALAAVSLGLANVTVGLVFGGFGRALGRTVLRRLPRASPAGSTATTAPTTSAPAPNAKEPAQGRCDRQQ